MPNKISHKRTVLVPDTVFSDKLKEIFNACGFWIDECQLPMTGAHGGNITICLFSEQDLNFAGKKGHKGWVGKAFENDRIRYVVFPEVNGGIEDAAGFQRAIGVLQSVKMPKDVIHVIKTDKELAEAIRHLNEMPHVVCDFETRTKEPFVEEARILTLAAGNKDCVYVMPLSHKQSPWLGNVTAQRDFLRAVYFAKNLIAFNAKFELRWFLALGFKPRLITFDPMVVHHMFDENSAHDLETLASLFTKYGGYSYKFSSLLTDKHNYESAPVDALYEYNGMDVFVTDLITAELWKQLTESENEKLLDVWENINGPLITLLARMEHEGFHLDTEELVRLTEWYERKQSECEMRVRSYRTISGFFKSRPEFNFNSYDQMRNLLYGEDGLAFRPMKAHMTDPSPKFPTGQPSTDKEAIKAMKATGKHKDVLDSLSLRTKCNSMLKSFLYVFAKKLEESTTGKLHTNFNQHVVETFRLSSSGPNMMNLPRSEDLASLGLEFPKKAFVSRFDDGELIQADLSQIELRVAGMYSKDPVFINAFAVNKDLHGEMAERVYGRDYTKEQRYKAKRTNFSAVFDISPEALAGQIDATVEEAEKLITEFRRLHVVLYEWFDKLWEQAQYDGWVENFSGERRHINWELSRARKQHEIDAVRRSTWNFPIQSSAAFIMKSGMLQLQKEFYAHKSKSLIIGMVHDSIIVDAAPGESKFVMSEIKRVWEKMDERYDWITVPVRIDVAHGPNLHDLEEWNA